MKHNAPRGRIFFRSAVIRDNVNPWSARTITAFAKVEFALGIFVSSNIKRWLA